MIFVNRSKSFGIIGKKYFCRLPNFSPVSINPFPVSSKKNLELEEKMHSLGIRASDFEEHFIRSGGHGGQNVNKVSTCVVLKHLPTGLEVRCQRERSQSLNRFFARRLLVEKIEALHEGRESEKRKAIQKLRRQKRKRSKRAKDKMLAQKKEHSFKKTLRSKIRSFEEG